MAESGHQLAFDSKKCPATSAIFYGKSNVDDPGEIVLNRDVQDSITFDSPYTFAVTVDGKSVTATLSGTYDKESLKNALNG